MRLASLVAAPGQGEQGGDVERHRRRPPFSVQHPSFECRQGGRENDRGDTSRSVVEFAGRIHLSVRRKVQRQGQELRNGAREGDRGACRQAARPAAVLLNPTLFTSDIAPRALLPPVFARDRPSPNLHPVAFNFDKGEQRGDGR